MIQQRSHASAPGRFASIRSSTLALVLACSVPPVVAVSVLAFDAYSRQQAQLLASADRLAQTLLALVERDLDTAAAQARALAASPVLAGGVTGADPAAVRQQASALVQPGFPAFAFVLGDPGGKPLLGTHLSENGGTPMDIVAVDVPVRIEGRVAYVVSALVHARRFAAAPGELHMPPGWAVEVADQRSRVVARNADASLTGTGRAGGIGAVHRSARHGWSVTVAAPRAAALQGTLPAMLAAIGALLALGFASAWWIGARIRRGVGERTTELEGSNALLATMYATAPVGMILLDSELRVTMVNDYLADMNGIAVADHLGRTLPELFGKAGVAYEKPFRDVRDSGVAVPALEVNTALPTSPQIERNLIVGYHPVAGMDGRLVGISAVVLDVGERKRLTERLHDVNEQFRALYDMSGDAHMLLEYGAGYLRGNGAAARMFGCADVDEFLGLTPASTSPPYQPDGRRSIEKADQFIRYAMTTGSHHFEWLHQRRDGSLFHADVLLIRLDIGGKGLLQGTVRDISARIAAEQALRATSERLESSERFIRTVADNVPGMVGYWDAQLRCQFANRLYLESFGRSKLELIGQPIDRVLTAEQLALNAPHLREVAAGRAAHFAQQMADADGQVRHTWSSYIPDLGADGQVRGFYVLAADVSELKRSELRLQSLNEQLVGALDRAETASSAKTQFLANMSHEIRTPMNAIMGLARLLEEAPLGRREREYVGKMTMSTRSLLGILNDVLDFSRIEAGQLELEYTAFSLEQVLRGISVLVEPNAFAKRIELVFDVAPEVPVDLLGDPMRLEQVLLNLIGNAIKFTEQGEVVLTIGVIDKLDSQVRLRFAVRDTGIGIAADKQERLFNAFSQGDDSTSRRHGGAGLGLAICRRLVLLMGGNIGVTSALGAGSVFSFDAPLGVGPAGDAAATVPAAPARRLLLVDDNASTRGAIAAQCRAQGWLVDSVGNAQDALGHLRSAAGDAAETGVRRSAYDLMLADSAMPGMDGITLLTEARSTLGAERVPDAALMVAESARERLDKLAGDLQVSAVIGKPVTPGTLTCALQRLSGTVAPALPAGPPALDGGLAGLHVLLVEDNQINQEVAHYILLHAGAQVDIAANGRIAVDLLREHPVRYDAVLMDVQMPIMNGYEASAEIRRMGLSTLPIVAMTANALEEDRVHALNAGMNGHVSKPIDVDSLIAALRRLTGGAGPGTASQAPGLPMVQTQPALPTIAGIDLAPTLQRFGGSYASFVRLFKRMESSQGSTLAQTRELIAAGRTLEALALLHRLRGVAANLGAIEVASLALRVEQDLRDGAAGLPEHLAHLEGALQAMFATARDLAAPPASERKHADGAPPGAADPASEDALQAALADLLSLLQNNNLKAATAFDALRPRLHEMLGSVQADAVEEAIATLAFANAAALIDGLLQRLRREPRSSPLKGNA